MYSFKFLIEKNVIQYVLIIFFPSHVLRSFPSSYSFNLMFSLSLKNNNSNKNNIQHNKPYQSIKIETKMYKQKTDKTLLPPKKKPK